MTKKDEQRLTTRKEHGQPQLTPKKLPEQFP
jgi:hypothetical protein